LTLHGTELASIAEKSTVKRTGPYISLERKATKD